ncbi:MAG: UDP-N-acetylglucosamine--LPS N-acetylglucosamine transferase [Opitutales bacterium]
MLTSSTGGGHDMRARAFKAWAESRQAEHLGLEVVILQTLESTSSFYNFGVWLYNWIQRVWPRLHHVYFNILEGLNLHRRARRILGADAFQEIVREVAPRVVISTHAHLNHGFFELARAALPEQSPACVTYCGELYYTYGFSRHWVNPRANLFIGAVEDTCTAARKRGMAEDRIWCGGFLMKPAFYKPRLLPQDRERFIREELRMDPNRFILVLATGANGANNHVRFLRRLDQAGVRPQVVALCGRDPRTLRAVANWAADHPQFEIQALHFYGEVHQLLQCASAVVARPGTGTTSEAILCGCPIIFNIIGGAMPQELITMRFFRRRYQWPRPVGRASSLPNRVRLWMDHPDQYARARRQMIQSIPRETPLAILQRVAALAALEGEADRSPVSTPASTPDSAA